MYTSREAEHSLLICKKYIMHHDYAVLFVYGNI